MARPRLPIAPHLAHEEIARRYRACRSGIEKAHWQVLRLLSRPEVPLSPARAAAQVGLTAGWARALLERWNAELRGRGFTLQVPPAQEPGGLHDRRAGGGRGPGPAHGRASPRSSRHGGRAVGRG